MRGVLFIILALLMLVAAPASLSKPFQPADINNLSEGIGQNNTSTPMAFGYPLAPAGGFQIMSSRQLAHALNSDPRYGETIWPQPLIPPFQVMFRGATMVNG